MPAASIKRTFVRGAPSCAVKSSRRTDKRTHTLLMVAKIMTASDVGLCRVLNVSSGGLHIKTEIEVAQDDAIAIAMSDVMFLRGRVVWSDNGSVGVKLNEAIDAALLLNSLAEAQRSGRTRAARLPVRVSGEMRSEGGESKIDVIDLSQHGMKIAHQGRLRKGAQVELSLSDGSVYHGTVRWSTDDFAGLRLSDEFRWQALGSMRRFTTSLNEGNVPSGEQAVPTASQEPPN